MGAGSPTVSHCVSINQGTAHLLNPRQSVPERDGPAAGWGHPPMAAELRSSPGVTDSPTRIVLSDPQELPEDARSVRTTRR